MKEILIRLNAETPTFFKKVIKIGLCVGGVGVAILGTPVTLAGAGIIIVLPTVVSTLAGYMSVCGLLAASLAKLTVADTSVLPK